MKPIIGLKRLEQTVESLTLQQRVILQAQFNQLWEEHTRQRELYVLELSYGSITKGAYRRKIGGKLKRMRDELYQTAKMLRA
jgi:hypothetical protein